jgi:hypothetical protein
MKKSRMVLFGVVILIVIVLAVWAGIIIAGSFSGNNTNGPSPYSAVYLSTGEIYFGKLSWWPSPHMTDVWYLQRTQGANNQPQVSIQPMSSVFWGPSDEIDLNAKNIIFSTRLMNNSQVVLTMENPASATGQSQPSSATPGTSATPQTQNSAASSASSTPSGK